MSLLPTIWPRRRAETGSFPILAETSGDYPVQLEAKHRADLAQEMDAGLEPNPSERN